MGILGSSWIPPSVQTLPRKLKGVGRNRGSGVGDGFLLSPHIPSSNPDWLGRILLKVESPTLPLPSPFYTSTRRDEETLVPIIN